MTSAMMRVLRMPAQLHSPRAPATAPATMATPPSPSTTLMAQEGARARSVGTSVETLKEAWVLASELPPHPNITPLTDYVAGFLSSQLSGDTAPELKRCTPA